MTAPDELLVGADTGDDAAVWRLDESRALVVTADFITPIVDDARAWGRIAAANAVSDVYAMGGRPLLALNLVGWNRDELPLALLGEVLAGASEVAASSGFVVAGGHTVDDPEPKFGLAVVGEADPRRLLTNAGLRAGDRLVLTKALGVGVIATAIKQGRAPAASVEAALASMERTNEAASRIALAHGATGATDVTGFGLLGHLGRMAAESSVDAVIRAADVPTLPGVPELVAADLVPGGTRRNLDWARERLDGSLGEAGLLVLADAQTSGGLLFGVSPGEVGPALEELIATGHAAAEVGHVIAGSGRLTAS